MLWKEKRDQSLEIKSTYKDQLMEKELTFKPNIKPLIIKRAD